MNNKYRYYGINDDESVCSHCGKKGLKRVVWLAELDEEGNEVSEPAPYGTTCAAEMLGWRYGTRNQTKSRFNTMLNDAVQKEASEKLSEYVKNGVFVLYTMYSQTNQRYQKYYVTVELLEMLRNNKVCLSEALKIRDKQYPYFFNVNFAAMTASEKTEMLKNVRKMQIEQDRTQSYSFIKL